MATFIYILQLKSPYEQEACWTDETRATLGRHWNYLVDLHAKGVMKIVGRTEVPIENPENRGIAIFTAEDEAAAKLIMENDPCIKEGVMEGKLFPFNFALGGK